MVLHTRIVTGTGGGPDKTILNSPRFLDTFGYESICAYMHPPEDPGFQVLEQRAQDCRAPLVSIPDRGLRDPSVIGRMLKVCKENKVTIWHGHDYKSNALGLLLRKFWPMKLVSTVHGWGVRSLKTPLYYKIDRSCLRYYDKVICVSDELYQQCCDARIAEDRLLTIPNGIDLSAYPIPDDTQKAAAKSALGLSSDRFVIGSIGRLSGEKGFDHLIHALADLLECGYPADLVLAGDGDERARLMECARDHGVAQNVRFLGHVSDPRSVYSALDVFVLSSLSEGLPNVLLEAMATGVPIVATRVGGIPSVLTNEYDGLLVAPGSADQLTVALTRIAHNDVLFAELGQNARSTAEKRFCFEKRMQSMRTVYDELLQLNADQQVTVPRPSDIAIKYAKAAISDLQGNGLPSLDTIESDAKPIRIECDCDAQRWQKYLAQHGYKGFHQWPTWSRTLQTGLGHEPYFLQAVQGGHIIGVLPLMKVETRLFGRFLVSLPYVNTAGVIADNDCAAAALIDQAVELADELDVKNLELRHEQLIEHPKLAQSVTDKVHMRLALPATTDLLWDGLKSKVRSQIRKPLNNQGFTIEWGGHDKLNDFYKVFCINMRDLETPPFSRNLFASILDNFGDDAEICCVRLGGKVVASGLLVHGPGTTQVPSASSLRSANSTNANMLMYWHLLSRAVERNQQTFDFGRSSRDSGTFRFKKQWGATAVPAVWQHYVRQGDAQDMRPNSGKYDLMIRTWQKLPVWTTKLIGPSIVRGIP